MFLSGHIMGYICTNKRYTKELDHLIYCCYGDQKRKFFNSCHTVNGIYTEGL